MARDCTVEKPSLFGGGCWAHPRQYTGSLFAQYAPCAKPARPGKLTCHWHDRYEAVAQALKAKEQTP